MPEPYVPKDPVPPDPLAESLTSTGSRGMPDALTEPTPQAPNPLDPNRFRLPTNYSELAPVKSVLTACVCRNPHGQEFVRVHASDEFRLSTMTLTDKNDSGRVYLVEQELWTPLAGNLTPATIVTAVTNSGDLFLWRLRLPGPDGRLDTAGTSAIEAAKFAVDKWCQVAWDMSLKRFTTKQPLDNLAEPTWPDDLNFGRLIQLAFGDRHIDSMAHPVIKRIRGAL